jgi:serine/threonine-protein kinase
MGVVWLAERADGLFKRPVALKLPHPGPQARQLVERFAREREILAALDHPHIARLYDAGVSAQGQPSLAIEYVEGERLDTWCDRQRLGLAERVRLFIDVLHAVQYAHGRLVVHRDLKPANILVTREAGVKLLDFGIARLLGDPASDQTTITQIGGLALTPDYASPEQITGSPIGVASDIYSLGVVLYELLLGRRPYKLQRQSRGALEDAIVAVDVTRPSEVAIEDAVAEQRASDPARLRRQLKGELDTILLAALAKAPAARFETCSAFADDLQRYLDGRPVRGRAGSGLSPAR